MQPEDEADPEERDNFLQQLYKFMEDRGEGTQVNGNFKFKDPL